MALFLAQQKRMKSHFSKLKEEVIFNREDFSEEVTVKPD